MQNKFDNTIFCKFYIKWDTVQNECPTIFVTACPTLSKVYTPSCWSIIAIVLLNGNHEWNSELFTFIDQIIIVQKIIIHLFSVVLGGHGTLNNRNFLFLIHSNLWENSTFYENKCCLLHLPLTGSDEPKVLI